MDTTLIAQDRSDHTATAKVLNDAFLQPSRAQARTRTLDDDYECRQRNCPPPLDWQLIRAAADLDN